MSRAAYRCALRSAAPAVAGLALVVLAGPTAARAALPLISAHGGDLTEARMEVDSKGNVYLLAEYPAGSPSIPCEGAGTSVSPDAVQSLVVAKYDETGGCEWMVKVSSPGVAREIELPKIESNGFHDTLHKADLAISEDASGAVQVYVAGLFSSTNLATKLGLVTIGGTDSGPGVDFSYPFPANGFEVPYLARIADAAVAPPPGTPPVDITVGSIGTAGFKGWCATYANLGGVAAAGRGGPFKLLLGVSGRDDCDHNTPQWAVEAGVGMSVTTGAIYRLFENNGDLPGGGGQGYVDQVEGRTSGSGQPVVILRGRRGDALQAYLASYSFSLHAPGWHRDFLGGAVAPLSHSGHRVADLELEPGAANVSLLLRTANWFLTDGCPQAYRDSVIRLSTADGTLLADKQVVTPENAFLDRLAFGADGRLFVAGRQLTVTYVPPEAPNPLGSCNVTQDAMLVVRAAEGASTFDATWTSNATAGGVAQPQPNGIASAGTRLFVHANFRVSVDFAGDLPPLPQPPLGAAAPAWTLHRLSPVNGEWYREQDWVASASIARPARTLPGVEPLARLPGDIDGSGDDFVHWDPTGGLFALHPLPPPPTNPVLTLSWATGTCQNNPAAICGVDADCPSQPDVCNPAAPGESVESYGAIRWPDTAQEHLAGAPADVGSGSPAFVDLLYSDGDLSTLISGRFSRAEIGYSVLKYAGPALQVVRTRTWEEMLPLEGGTCTVGTPIATPDATVHNDPSGANGYPLGNAPVDVLGVFDESTRAGALVPVNTTVPGVREMRIAWYQPDVDGLGRAWPTQPRFYTCNWPAAPTGILFPDSLMGSAACRCAGNAACVSACGGLANAGDFPSVSGASLYIQNDPAQKGYNPNDEHALLAAANASPPCLDLDPVPAWCTTAPVSPAPVLYALRRQSVTTESDPYVILRTPAAPGSPPNYHIYRVAMSGAGNTFTFNVEVGDAVPKPFPLTETDDCPGTVITDVTGTPSWKAADNVVYARADGTMDADFFYRGRVAQQFYPAAGCHQWLEEANVRYAATWPDDIPTLFVGQSLSTLRDGFPDLAGATAAQVVFEGDPDAPSVIQSDRYAVRLFDPLVTRYVGILARDLDLFRELKARVPSHVGIRLEIDELGPRLGWKGIREELLGDDPLLLPNVIAPDERLELQTVCGELLAGGSDPFSVCLPTVAALDVLTRSPYGLAAGPTEVLVGLGADGKALRLENAIGKVLSAGAADGVGYATVAIDNGVPGREVQLFPMRISCTASGGPYAGIAVTVSGADVFGFDFGLRHGNDFGGEPAGIVFDWRRFERTDAIYSEPGSDWGTPTEEGADCSGDCWSGPLGNQIQISLDGSQPIYIGDTYFFVRYSMPGVCAQPSSWTGDPRSVAPPFEPVAKLAEGWVKRVVQGLNPFHQRIVDFHGENSPVATYVSMIRQAGPAYEGPITFNPAADSVNDRGLVETYETVLRRALELTVENPAYLPSASIDNALLLVSGRIADLYVLLGNEAWADAVDPTIGFGTESGEYGTLAPSIHAFQNQLPSLLEEELALLRGVDAYGLRPVYNRLIWNFTAGEGEAAYAQVYGITDQDGNGDVGASDARVLYPQGHGDAWGHYLTSMVEYLRLLREPDFVWKPRVEAVQIAGATQLVDYRDERKLATVAAARARTGAEVVDLTYRREFVQDPNGQWQGYKDPDRLRAWGVDDWARRAAQGAYLDWALANAVLPSQWQEPGVAERRCDLVAEGVNVPEEECYRDQGGLTFAENGEVDRPRVPELAEIVQRHREIAGTLDEADQGLNPLGLARGVVPFDIDPSFLDVGSVIQGQTHFQQIYLRATAALDNAISTFDHANRVTQMLRQSQDSLVDFDRNVEDQERDFRNRLIEIFGRPYPDDAFYPPGYEGPDLRHYAYVDARDLTGMPPIPTFSVGQGPAGSSTLCYQRSVPPGTPCGDIFPTESEYCALLDPTDLPEAEETCVDSELGLVKPVTWNATRPAEGELQRIYSEHLRAVAALEQSSVEYDNLRAEIEAKAELIEIHTGSLSTSIMILDDALDRTKSLGEEIQQQREIARGLRTGAGFTRGIMSALAETLTYDVEADATGAPAAVNFVSLGNSLAKAAFLAVSETIGFGLDLGADAAENAVDSLSDKRDLISLQTERRLLVETEFIEVEELVREIESLLRQEPVIALQAFDRQEAVRSTAVAWRNKLGEGLRLMDELVILRQRAAADVQRYRYQDLTFRIARNDALQKYRAQFDLAARYTYLAAAAYDYETNLLATAGGAGQDFFTDIVRHRSLGEVLNGEPAPGSRGLADPLGRMKANFDVLEGQLGFNNPQTETNYFSLRSELMRMRDSSTDAWRRVLQEAWVDNLWSLPEFRRLARPFAPEGSQPEPALVFRFPTTVTSGLNFFGWPLGGQDSTYDSSRFATKVRTVGLWLENYAGAGLSNTPRVYLIPVGADILRSPNAFDFATREWNVVDQVIPVPFPIGELNLQDPDWIPLNDSLSGQLGASRRFSRFRAYHDAGFDPEEMTTDSRLVGRSVWNSEWLLIIPGETLKGPTLEDKIQGLETFIDSVTDLKLFFQTYSYSGN